LATPRTRKADRNEDPIAAATTAMAQAIKELIRIAAEGDPDSLDRVGRVLGEFNSTAPCLT
jgi:hypothetical protein